MTARTVVAPRDSSDIGPCIHGRDPRTRCEVEACHAPPKPRGKRRVLAFMVRDGTERGEGRYLSPNDGVWGDRWEAIVFAPTFRARGNARAFAKNHGGRVVAIVRHEPRDWAKLVEEHAALTAKVARLTANHADWLRLLADTRAALGVEAGGSLIDAANRLSARVAELAGYQEQCEMLETAQRARVAILAGIEADRDAWKARAEEAEAPAPARVLRDGEGGCEPLQCSSTSATGTQCAHGHGHVGAHHDGTAAWRDEPAKPQPFAGLYVYATGTGYVLTRRGCDLLDALARKP